MFRKILRSIGLPRGKGGAAGYLKALKRYNISESDVALVSASGFFDELYYTTRYPEVPAAGVEFPILHFILNGGIEGRSPSAKFDSQWYLKTYSDVFERRENPLLHYLKWGRGAGRLPGPVGLGRGGAALDSSGVFIQSPGVDPSGRSDSSEFVQSVIASQFDESFYVQQRPDLGRARAQNPDFSLVKHYIEHGVFEDLNPTSWFGSSAYLDLYPDVRKSGINPFFHYIQFGQAEGRQSISTNRRLYQGAVDVIADKFDYDYYSNKYSDIPTFGGGVDLLFHYTLIGWREGRNPCGWFSVSDYFDLNPDVEKSNIEPFSHYVSHGREEGRVPCRKIQRRICADPLAPRVLFVGHTGNQTGAEVMLLDIVSWYADNTAYEIDILLLEPGILANKYQQYGNIHIIKTNNIEAELEKSGFLRAEYDYIYLNTVVSSRFYPIYNRYYSHKGVPLLLHVHELSGVIKLFEDDFIRISSCISIFIAASDSVRDCLCSEYGIEESRVETVFSFVRAPATTLRDCMELRVSARAAFGFADSDVVVVGAGTVYSRKGVDLFVDTLTSVIQSVSGAVFAVWIGGGEELEAMQSLVRQRGLDQKIRFIGFRPDARNIIAMGDIFFLSSREDPFPLVCLEAGSFAIPTVHFSKGTGIFSFTRGGAGLECEAFDCESAAQAIVSLVDNPRVREKMGLEARSRVLDHFEYGKACLRLFLLLRERFSLEPYVSVIIPNYNHERYLTQRFQSVSDQTIKDIEIIVLDDASIDNSDQIIQKFLSDTRVSYLKNDVCSRSPFRQWAKGLSAARARLVWIAESDDFCSNNLIEALAPAFNEGGVAISFCRTEVVDEYGSVKSGALVAYLNGASKDRYINSFDATGYSEINAAMASRCTLVNASSALFLREHLLSVVHLADGFKMCGDWRIYIELLKSGGVHFDINATNFFRRHSASTVHKLEGTDLYFEERSAIAMAVASNFSIERATAGRMVSDLFSEWTRFSHKDKSKQALSDYFDEPAFWLKIKNGRLKRRHIAFYVHGMLFSKGGIERLAANLAVRLSTLGYRITIFCRIWGRVAPIYSVGRHVEVVPVFDETRVDWSILELRRELLAREVEVFVPMLSEWLFEPVILAAESLDIRIIASEHNDPWKLTSLWWDEAKREETFRRVDRIHMLVDEFKESLPKDLVSKVSIIPNFVEGAAVTKREEESKKRFVGIGRLVEQKCFERAILAMNIVLKYDQDAVLDIFGEGGDREKLQGLIVDLGLGSSVRLRGVTEHVFRELSDSVALVAPSRFEGFGIVAAEAKLVGKPTIAYEDCSGLNSIIHNEMDGLLVAPDETGESLAAAMIRLLDEPELADRLRRNAKLDASNYSPDVVVQQWIELLEEV